MKAIEQNFHVVLFIILHKVVLLLKSVDKTQVSGHSNERYYSVLSCGNVPYKVTLSFDETLVSNHSD